jgi:hypothetical protein
MAEATEQETPVTPGPKIKVRKPRQRACDEKNAKGKMCAGHIKRYYDYAGQEGGGLSLPPLRDPLPAAPRRTAALLRPSLLGLPWQLLQPRRKLSWVGEGLVPSR